MNTMWQGAGRWLVLAGWALGALGGGALRGADVNSLLLLKGQLFLQTNAGAAGPEGASNYVLQAMIDAPGGGVTNAVLMRPNNAPLVLAGDGEGYRHEESFASQSALNAAFPSGTNTFTLGTVNDGPRKVVLNLAGDVYPATPHFSNYTAAQAVDAGLAFTVGWDVIAGATTNDFVQLSVRTGAGTEVLSSPSPGQPGALDGTATAQLIPARKLRPGQAYTVELLVARFTDYNPVDYPGAPGLAAYFKRVQMVLVTTGTAVNGGPGNFQLVFNFTSGSFSGTNGTISYPQPIAYFNGLYNVSGDSNYPATVTFTGPAGSGMTNLTNQYVGSSFGSSAFYSTPPLWTSTNGRQPGELVSALPPGGVYAVNYKGSNAQFNLLDPLAAQQQVLVVPTVVLSASNTLQEIRWTYRDTNGASVGPQAYMEDIQIRVDGFVGGRLYDAGGESNGRILPATTNHVLTQSVPWTNVSLVSLLFMDTAGNQYVSYWSMGQSPVQITTASLPTAGRGTNYSFLLSATGGSQQFTNWTLLGGFLPSGLFLAEGTGEIQGRPGESGAFNFTVKVTDSLGASTNRTLSLTVLPGPFPEPAVAGVSLGATGQTFRLQLQGVTNQTYTIETSSDLVAWQPVYTFVLTPDLLNLVDPEGIAAHPKYFYRLRLGRAFHAELNLHLFTEGGNFAGGTTPSVAFPLSVGSYAAACITINDGYPPAPASVLFTGPGGTGLSASPASAQTSSITLEDNLYQSDTLTNSPAAAAGAWTVNYQGTNFNFTLADPQTAARLVIPVPTVTVAGGQLQSVSWVYKNPATGATYAQPPAHLKDIAVQVDAGGSRVYNSDNLPPATTSTGLDVPVVWTDVTMLHLVYNDTLNNHYVISFRRP